MLCLPSTSEKNHTKNTEKFTIYSTSSRLIITQIRPIIINVMWLVLVVYKCKKRLGYEYREIHEIFHLTNWAIITQVYIKFNKLIHRIFHLTNWAIITQIYENSINFYMNIEFVVKILCLKHYSKLKIIIKYHWHIIIGTR